MKETEETSKQKVIYILPTTVVSSPMNRIYVFNRYRKPIENMQACFGESY